MAPEHELFNKPRKVSLTFEERETPKHYKHYADGAALGPRLQVWKVQNRKFPAVDPGLVSEPSNFDSAPDAEIIASGLNSKGPRSVAIGRHGNFLLWGFSGGPADMTPQARDVFVNAVCYAHKFDRQPPLARRTGWTRGRGWALVQARRAESEDDETFRRSYPAALREQFGRDGAKYERYYRENLEYLTLEVDEFKLKLGHVPQPLTALAFRFLVDEDVKKLGVSNRSLALLERCVRMLEEGKDTDLAMRVLRRYTSESFDNAAGWRAWLEKNRDRLFFTDIGGYCWITAPRPLTRGAP